MRLILMVRMYRGINYIEAEMKGRHFGCFGLSMVRKGVYTSYTSNNPGYRQDSGNAEHLIWGYFDVSLAPNISI